METITTIAGIAKTGTSTLSILDRIMYYIMFIFPSFRKEYKRINKICLNRALSDPDTCLRILQPGYLSTVDQQGKFICFMISKESKHTVRILERFKSQGLLEEDLNKKDNKTVKLTPYFFVKNQKIIQKVLDDRTGTVKKMLGL